MTTMLHAEPLSPCSKHNKALTLGELQPLLVQVPHWHVQTRDGIPQLHTTFRCADFSSALALCNAIAALAEAADHHPRLILEWGSVSVDWWSHVIRGLHRNDFIMAARCDLAHQQLLASGALP